MKRHPALQDLSRDHHLVLIQCQRIRRAHPQGAPPVEILGLAGNLLRFYESDMAAHFQEEDDFVVPVAEEAGDLGLSRVAKAVHADHAWFRACLAELSRSAEDAEAAGRILGEIEARLVRHVRLEEEELFEGVQRAVPEARLEAMWRDSYAFRSAHRAPSACTVRPAAKNR